MTVTVITHSAHLCVHTCVAVGAPVWVWAVDSVSSSTPDDEDSVCRKESGSTTAKAFWVNAQISQLSFKTACPLLQQGPRVRTHSGKAMPLFPSSPACSRQTCLPSRLTSYGSKACFCFEYHSSFRARHLGSQRPCSLLHPSSRCSTQVTGQLAWFRPGRSGRKLRRKRTLVPRPPGHSSWEEGFLFFGVATGQPPH